MDNTTFRVGRGGTKRRRKTLNRKEGAQIVTVEFTGNPKLTRGMFASISTRLIQLVLSLHYPTKLNPKEKLREMIITKRKTIKTYLLSNLIDINIQVAPLENDSHGLILYCYWSMLLWGVCCQ